MFRPLYVMMRMDARSGVADPRPYATGAPEGALCSTVSGQHLYNALFAVAEAWVVYERYEAWSLIGCGVVLCLGIGLLLSALVACVMGALGAVCVAWIARAPPVEPLRDAVGRVLRAQAHDTATIQACWRIACEQHAGPHADAAQQRRIFTAIRCGIAHAQAHHGDPELITPVSMLAE